MKEEYVTSFREFAEICKQIAYDLHTLVEIREYPQYDWASVIFETDKFGGSYLGLHYDYNTGVVTAEYGTDRAQEIYDEDQLRALVKRERDYMLQHRDMQYISDMINAEYY